MEPTKNQKLVLTADIAKKLDTSRHVKVSFTNTKANIETRNRNRMKVTLKFGAEEAEGFNNFCRLAKPEKMAQDDFVKFIFYKGVEALQLEFAARIEEFKQNNPEEFEKMRAEAEAAQKTSEGSITVAEEAPKL
jgi:hypothetical protein